MAIKHEQALEKIGRLIYSEDDQAPDTLRELEQAILQVLEEVGIRPDKVCCRDDSVRTVAHYVDEDLGYVWETRITDVQQKLVYHRAHANYCSICGNSLTVLDGVPRTS